ncbi:uncharacterized protein EAF02_007964 [Botrytis sinoallii]|uniref:uncharacterized protein n=1 Tax=Botrytis sinoallii TaxID=1463999 RepID=UPI001900E47F|nr:uncharacterized protein EAF02_007964 [Botrytis sinoallii]KAF7879794.1 hypothetical protein EAF02_007964 [Botrytis sinoallii]
MSTPDILFSSLETNTTRAYRQHLINHITKTPISSLGRLHLRLNLLDLEKFKLKNYHHDVMNKPLPAGTTMTDVMKRNALFVKHVKFLDNQQTMVRKQLLNAIRKIQIQESIIRTAPAEIRSKLLNGQKLFGQLQAEIACDYTDKLLTRSVNSQRQEARRSNAPSPSTVSLKLLLLHIQPINNWLSRSIEDVLCCQKTKRLKLSLN